MGYHVKGLTEVEIGGISGSSLVHWCSGTIIKGDQVGPAGFAHAGSPMSIIQNKMHLTPQMFGESSEGFIL